MPDEKNVATKRRAIRGDEPDHLRIPLGDETGFGKVATNNSGFMFIGLIAYTYRVGIESIWMMIGWVVGDFAA